MAEIKFWGAGCYAFLVIVLSSKSGAVDSSETVLHEPHTSLTRMHTEVEVVVACTTSYILLYIA